MNAFYKTSSTYKRCYESHPPLEILDYKIYGGSCGSPIVHDADVYVGFDYSMKKSTLSYPWNSGDSFLFHIQDGGVPMDVAEFRNLLTWLSAQLTANKKVHLGCIGGHGRTGTVLAALVLVMTGNKDAIQYVRENYCKKAVESQAQVHFLQTHFGLNPAVPSKHSGKHNGYDAQGDLDWVDTPKPTKTPKPQQVIKGRPKMPTCIWGPLVVFDNSSESGIIKV